jgi:hypothetical protein
MAPLLRPGVQQIVWEQRGNYIQAVSNKNVLPNDRQNLNLSQFRSQRISVFVFLKLRIYGMTLCRFFQCILLAAHMLRVFASFPQQAPSMRIGLLVEPTPFTHVSGYSNRFQEMLLFLEKAGDEVEIVTVDDKERPPEYFASFRINTIKGFRFPLYTDICLTFDVKQRSVWKSMNRFKPDIIHCSSPGFIVFIALFTAKVLDVPLVLSYHTHLPQYTKEYVKMVPGSVGEAGAWQIIRWVHNRADLTLVTSPQVTFEAHHITDISLLCIIFLCGLHFAR